MVSETRRYLLRALLSPDQLRFSKIRDLWKDFRSAVMANSGDSIIVDLSAEQL
jgi:hypothetical protein